VSEFFLGSASGMIAKGIHECPVLQIEKVARGIFLMRLCNQEISRRVLPGQFVNVLVRDEPIPLLRRPFSVCRTNPAEGTFDLLWKIYGRGTALMAQRRRGDHFNVLGPLGHGFSISPTLKCAIVIAGGLGVAPMPLLIGFLRAQGAAVQVLLGARTKGELWGAEMFEAQGAVVRLATDDGSNGLKGFVTALLQEELRQPHDVEVFACGPMPMLAKVAQISLEAKVSAQLAVETVMGCGFGICMGCPIMPAAGVKTFGRYLLACVDGPVFRAGEVVFRD